jgi:hypothetical protein
MVNPKKAYWNGILALLLIGCGARSVQTSESNTNWLDGCDDAADCGSGLACGCGVCTKNCAEAACPAQLECLAECGGSCQKACSDDRDCAALNASAQCERGVCMVAGGLSNSAMSQLGNADSGVVDAPASEPSSAASTSGILMNPWGSDTPDDTSSPEDRVCRVGYVWYPEGAVIPADACGINECRCDASGEPTDCGALLLPCEFAGNGPIARCDEMFPDGMPDASPVDSALILGIVLSL